MARLETRELEFFVAVAEELHFGRAAERLLVAQPALSRTIRKTELRLGVQLFQRSSRRVNLTPAGEALLLSGRQALAAIDVAAHDAVQAGTDSTNLRLVLKPGGDTGLVSEILAAYERQSDGGTVELVFGGNSDCGDYVRDGRADLALLYAPFDDLTGLTYETLRVEERVAVLPSSHPLAARPQLQLAELEDEALPRWHGLAHDAWTGMPASAEGPRVKDLTEMNQLIALGRTVAVLPRSLTQPVPDGLVCIPVKDAEASRIVLAWREPQRSKPLATFVNAATGTAYTRDLERSDDARNPDQNVTD